MHQPLPSGTTEADRFARALAVLLGPAYQPADGTLVAADLRALGGALAGVHATVARAVAQAHPRTATDLLGELEEEYGLPDGASLTTAERQTRLAAKVRARFAGSPADILATLRTHEPAATLEECAAAVVLGTDPNAVFRFLVLLGWTPATAPDDVLAQLAALDAAGARLDPLLRQQQPAHTDHELGVRVGARCDDPATRCELALLER